MSQKKKHCVMRPGNFRRFLVDSSRCEFLGEPSPQSTDVEQTTEFVSFPTSSATVRVLFCSRSRLLASSHVFFFSFFTASFSRDYAEPPCSRRVFPTRSRTRSCAVEMLPIVFRSVAVECCGSSCWGLVPNTQPSTVRHSHPDFRFSHVHNTQS